MVESVKKPVKKAVRKRAAVAGRSEVGGVGGGSPVAELVRGSDLAVLAGVLTAGRGRLLAIESGSVDGGAGWLVVWDS